MAYFEYRLVPATTRRKPSRGGAAGPTLSELATELNMRALTGWEFVGSEQIVERRRRLFFLVESHEVACLVFRREVSPRVEAPKDHARALREAATEVPVRYSKKAELVQAVRDGHRRVRVRSTASPEYAAE